MKVRYPAVAGSFYPSDENELRKMIRDYLSKAKDVDIKGRLRALVEPHAGYIYSGPVAAYGYKLLEKHSAKIKKVLLIGPSHYAAFFGVAESNADEWETPIGKVSAGSARAFVRNKELITTNPDVHAPEHCLEVQLPFLQSVLKDFVIYPLLTGNVNSEELAMALVDQIDDSTLIIVSSDLSHYKPYDTALRIDSIANKAVPSLDIEKFEREGDACGKTAILTLMHIAKKKKWKGKLLDYRNSGDTAGPKDAVVGYGCYAFYE